MSAPETTTQARLAQSRERLLEAMGYATMTSNITGEPMLGKVAPPAHKEVTRAFGSALPAAWRASPALKWALRWWQQHPVHDIAAVARPHLEDYARRHPAKLVAIAAGTGSVIWLLKPWKRLSAAALLSLGAKAGSKALLKAAARAALR